MSRHANYNGQQGGYIALLAVLIAGAASTAIAVTLLASGSDAQRATLVVQQSAQARQLANACAEDALQAMHDAISFTGSNTQTLGAGSCSYTVVNAGGSARTVTASGTVGTIIRKITISATIGSSSISIASWQDSN